MNFEFEVDPRNDFTFVKLQGPINESSSNSLENTHC